ncbi:hypothetical protein HYV82_05365 [Candidatus Woesearchaeota archaeon]|nr:hypothetical protein [Candidatus Woesearchaeota archaeon]
MGADQIVWCAVVELGAGQYEVVPVPPMNLLDIHMDAPTLDDEIRSHPHILVEGTPYVGSEQLRSGIKGVVEGACREAAVHKDWQPPRLETLAERFIPLSYVARASVTRPRLPQGRS